MAFMIALSARSRPTCVKFPSPRIGLHVSPTLHGRLLSSGIRRVQPTFIKNAPPMATRSYFWSSKAATGALLNSGSAPSVTAEQSATNIEPADVSSASATADAPAAITESPSIIEPIVNSAEVSSLTPSLSDAAEVVSSVPGPIEFGYLYDIGLVGFSPAGLVRLTLEAIHVTTGMPWFYTIIAGTLMYRILIFPLAVEGLRNSARLLPFAPRLAAIGKEMKVAQSTRDLLAMQRVQLKQKKVYEDAGVKVGPMLLAQFAQLPVTLGLFFGVKGLCQFPLEQLKHSGFSILPDLTVADPYFILPALTALMINMQISVGSREMNLVERPAMGHLMNAMRVLSVLGIYLMGDLPSGVMISLLTGVSAMTFQSFILQQPRLRSALKIPVVPKEVRGKLPSFASSIQFAKDWWQEKKLEAQQAQQPALRRRK